MGTNGYRADKIMVTSQGHIYADQHTQLITCEHTQQHYGITTSLNGALLATGIHGLIGSTPHPKLSMWITVSGINRSYLVSCLRLLYPKEAKEHWTYWITVWYLVHWMQMWFNPMSNVFTADKSSQMSWVMIIKNMWLATVLWETIPSIRYSYYIWYCRLSDVKYIHNLRKRIPHLPGTHYHVWKGMC